MLNKILVVCLIFILSQSVGFCSQKFKITHHYGVYHIVIPTSTRVNRFDFVLSEKLITNKAAHDKYNSILTINTGFFDPVNEKTISFIYTDGILAEAPLLNENLIQNSEIMENWNKIANRPEFRVIKNDDGKFVYDIAYHDDPIEGELITSAQGGPLLTVNDLSQELIDEFFIVKDVNNKVIRESASVLHKCARTIIGLKSNSVHIFIVTNKRPMTIYDVQKLCKWHKLDKAMAFDGGSSTSLNYKNRIEVVSTGIKHDDTGRMLKSFMIYK